MEIEKYIEHSIVGVEFQDGMKTIHYYGYSYEADQGEPYRFVEYCGLTAPLKEALAVGVVTYEVDNGCEAKQYVTDADAEKIIDIYRHYDNGHEPKELPINELTIDTPCGIYRLEY